MGLLRRFSTRSNDSLDTTAIESIVRNLNNVLNSRRDYGSFLDDFGIDDLSHCTSRDALTTLLIDRVTACIERYEPRVELLELEAAPDNGPMRVSLIMSCRIKDSRKSFDLVFDTTGARMSVGRRE